jgi:hypothetical protein
VRAGSTNAGLTGSPVPFMIRADERMVSRMVRQRLHPLPRYAHSFE